MTILISADCFYPAQLGGPSNAIYWQASALTQVGHSVLVVATSHYLPSSVPTDCWLTRACGRVIYTKNPYFYLPIKHVWYGWKAMQQADVIHVNSLFYPASFVWVVLSGLIGKPVVWSPHGELSPVALTIRPRLKRILLRCMNRFRDSIVFHATSWQEATHVQEHFSAGAAVTIIPNRMVLPELVVPKSVASTYLLFMGRLHPIKAIDRLLQAVNQSSLFLASQYKLVIAGPTVDEAYTRRLLELIATLQLTQKVSLLGPVTGDEKEVLYANAYLTILPSHTENFGNVVIESLAQGTPVIASTNTPWQLLEAEQIGSWVSNEVTSLQQAIDSYLSMPQADYQGYRERAVNVARRQFDQATTVDEWERLYKRVSTRDY